MPTYSYTHVPDPNFIPNEFTKDFDVFQSIKDEPLKTCPECGAPVKRVITSAVGFTMAGGTPKFHG